MGIQCFACIFQIHTLVSCSCTMHDANYVVSNEELAINWYRVMKKTTSTVIIFPRENLLKTMSWLLLLIAPDAGPAAVIANVSGTTSINLSWTEIDNFKVNGMIQNYRLEIQRQQFLAREHWTPWQHLATVSARVRQRHVDGLLSSTDYKFRVSGSTNAGFGSPPAWTEAKLVTTAEDGEFARKRNSLPALILQLIT